MLTLPNLEFLNSENVKIKGCVHTWADGMGYTNMYNNKPTSKKDSLHLNFIIEMHSVGYMSCRLP